MSDMAEMAPANNSATINLKWNHRGTYHRFEIPREAGCSTLMKRITTIFPNFYGQIGWKDEDGDTVIISSDEELMHAASLPQNQQLLRLFTIEKPTDEVAVNSTNNDCKGNATQKKELFGKGISNNCRREQLTTEVHSGSRRLLLMAQEQLLNTQKLFRKSVRTSTSGSRLSVKAKTSNIMDTNIKDEKRNKTDSIIKVNENKTSGAQPNLKSMFSVAKRKITGGKSKKILENDAVKKDVNCDKLTNKTESIILNANMESESEINEHLKKIAINTATQSEVKVINDDKRTKLSNTDVNNSAEIRTKTIAKDVKIAKQKVDKNITNKEDTECSNKSVSSDSDIEIIEKSEGTTTHETDDWTVINCSGRLQEGALH